MESQYEQHALLKGERENWQELSSAIARGRFSGQKLFERPVALRDTQVHSVVPTLAVVGGDRSDPHIDICSQPQAFPAPDTWSKCEADRLTSHGDFRLTAQKREGEAQCQEWLMSVGSHASHPRVNAAFFIFQSPGRCRAWPATTPKNLA
jgi:hypothetical protein